MTEASSSPEIAAEATVLALRGSVGAEAAARISGYRLLPDATILSRVQAIAALASRPKPLVCSSSAAGDVLSINCAPMRDRELQGWTLWRRTTVDKDRLHFLQAFAATEDSPLMLRGYGEVLLLPYREFERWLGEYDFRGMSFSMTDPSETERRSGAVGVVRFGER